MSFPASPVNGQTATVNGINYFYSSTLNSWTRFNGGNFNLSNARISGSLISSSNVALGNFAGYNNQAVNAVAIGAYAGYYQPANSIVLNATGNVINGNVAGLFVSPIRTDSAGTLMLVYNPTTSEVTTSNVVTFNSNVLAAPLIQATDGIVINSKTISANAAIPINSGAQSIGPITQSPGVTVTLGIGSTWKIL